MLTTLQNETLNGLLLGDGCLEMANRGKNPCLKITRAYTDLEYLSENAETFSNYLTEKSVTQLYKTHDKRTNKTYFSSRLRTKCSEDLLPFYRKWYSNKIKHVPNDLELTPLTIAIWLADDGHINNPGHRMNLLNIKFCTHGFTKEDVQFLSTLLSRRYKFQFPTYNDSGKYIIRLNNSEQTKIVLRDIDPFFPKSMSRKSIAWRKSEAKLHFKKTYPPCKWCNDTNVYKNGKENGKQKFHCQSCNKQFYGLDLST